MNFKIELDEKICMQNNKNCPMSDFDFISLTGECRYYNTTIIAHKNGWYVRCPECLAEEEKQLTVEDCEITEHLVEENKEHACETEGVCDLQNNPNAPCRNVRTKKGCPLGHNEVYKRRSK